MSVKPQEFGVAAALSLRVRTMNSRLVLIGLIAVLLGVVGHWRFAPAWFCAYVACQFSLVWSKRRRDRLAFTTDRIVYALAFASFCVVGFPTWYMWTQCGELGIAAATMFLCGMLVQLVVSSLGSAPLFWFSAAPLIGYLMIVPPLAFGPHRWAEGLTTSTCAIILVSYLVVLSRGHQRALQALDVGRQTAMTLHAEAESASQAKSDFLAVMSHEVRTPLNAVLGAASLLARTTLAGDQRAHVEMISDASDALRHVLNDVLDLSKIEAGKLELSRADVDVRHLIGRCARLWEPQARDKGLELAVWIEPTLPAYLSLDEMRVGQILFNLVSNAIKFTDQGQVAIQVSWRPIEAGAELSIAVEDTGAGIAPEIARTLFQPFQQADVSVSRRHGGSGLGLAISRRLAEMMGGEIRLASRPGAGSVFTLSLPAAIGAEPAQAADWTEGKDVETGLRILVAEDNPSNQRVITLFLEPVGAQLTMAANGREALEALAIAPFDVVLMDVQMPVMDGLEATRALRAGGGPNADVPVIALTANAMESQRLACLAAGMDSHVAKPIDARLLMTAIASAATLRAGADQRPGAAARA